jgi:hypothetical protein
MDSAILTALAGVWESLVGGSATGHATLGRIALVDLSRLNGYMAARIDWSSMQHASPKDLSGSGARLAGALAPYI